MIAVGRDAHARLAEHARSAGWSSALLVLDANTEQAAGSAVSRQLAGAGVVVDSVRWQERAGLLADEHAIGVVRRRLGESSPDGLVAVGAGVLTDITRCAAFQERRGFVSVPTAASNDGYASSVAVVEGAEGPVEVAAVAPEAVFADLDVLVGAPRELTRAGLGELLAKASARADWLAAHVLRDEPFAPEVDGPLLVALIDATRDVEAVLDGRPEAVESLMRRLLAYGAAVTELGSSRPARGCEHQVSDVWDVLATREGRERAPHGLQVAYASLAAMRLQRYAFGGELDEPARERLSHPLALFDLVEEALGRAGVADEPFFSEMSPVDLRDGFRHARRGRSGWTVLDFLDDRGLLDRALDAVLPVTEASPR